ncbi:hypothetical protein J6590_044572 [Homalodisca vitripennis]|nr:hypothetical protein J6590_044572 [Homalodisca vitripennis]
MTLTGYLAATALPIVHLGSVIWVVGCSQGHSHVLRFVYIYSHSITVKTLFNGVKSSFSIPIDFLPHMTIK